MKTNLAGLVGVAILLTAVADHPAHGLEDDELVRHFDVVALRREFTDDANPRILKWQDPIRFYIGRLAEIADEDVVFLQRHILELHDITGLEMSYVERPQLANFRILFILERDFLDTAKRYFAGDEKMIARVVKRANCLAVFGSNARGALDSVTVVIPIDKANKAGLLRRCMLEETTQSLGLVNDSKEIGRSLFNNSAPDLEEFNYHDRTLLKILYDPRIEPGMTREQALPIVRAIVPGLR